MLYYLKFLENYWGPFRLFEYQSVRAVFAGMTALLVGFVIAPCVLRFLRHVRQPERSAALMGAIAKQGNKVPTMGGLLILISAIVSAVLWIPPNIHVGVALFVFLGMGLVGLWDDYLKVKHKSSDGLSEVAKFGLLCLVAFVAIGILLATPATRAQAIELWVPFFKKAVITADTLPLWLGIPFAAIFFCLVTVGSSNAVNLTDGIDGLAIGCVISTLLTFGIVAYVTGRVDFASYLKLSYVAGAGELGVLTAAILGGCLVFLWYNAAPAEIYMGDVGALGLGGAIGAIAFMVNQPILLVIVGGIFVSEAISVIVQRGYFKYTKAKYGQGIRILAKSPLHHHFQIRPRRPWADTKIVIRFWLLSLLCGLAGLMTLKLR